MYFNNLSFNPLFAKKRAKIPYFEKRKENGFLLPL
jgi:hypothetical protein